jgi:hypothetical protein
MFRPQRLDRVDDEGDRVDAAALRRRPTRGDVAFEQRGHRLIVGTARSRRNEMGR